MRKCALKQAYGERTELKRKFREGDSVRYIYCRACRKQSIQIDKEVQQKMRKQSIVQERTELVVA